MLHTKCYISNSVNLWQNHKLEALFSFSKTQNVFRNVTGLLLYNEGTFLQVLEGEIDDVETLLSKIKKDDRHNQITIMMDQEISHRLFESYQSGMVFSDDEKELKKLKSRIQLPNASNYAKSLRAILHSFTIPQHSLSGYMV